MHVGRCDPEKRAECSAADWRHFALPHHSCSVCRPPEPQSTEDSGRAAGNPLWITASHFCSAPDHLRPHRTTLHGTAAGCCFPIIHCHSPLGLCSTFITSDVIIRRRCEALDIYIYIYVCMYVCVFVNLSPHS